MNDFTSVLTTPVTGYKTFNEFTTRFTLQILLTVLVATALFRFFPDVFGSGFDAPSFFVMIISGVGFTLYALFKDKQRFMAKLSCSKDANLDKPK